MLNKRATIYFKPELHKALHMKAINTDRSISDLVNEATQILLQEDYEDLKAFEDREKESVISFESMLEQLKKDGKI